MASRLLTAGPGLGYAISMARRRRIRNRILLPGEKESRLGFLKKGLVTAALVAAAGGFYVAGRETRPPPTIPAPLHVFSPKESAVLLALARRLVPQGANTSLPTDADLARRMDAIAAEQSPRAQQRLRRVVRLFESAVTGLLDGIPRTFTESTPAQQDRRIVAWSRSGIALRRSAFHSLQNLVLQAYSALPHRMEARRTSDSSPDAATPAQGVPSAEAAAPAPAAMDGAQLPVRMHGEPSPRGSSNSRIAEPLHPNTQRHVRSAPIAPRRVDSEVVDHSGLEPPLAGKHESGIDAPDGP